MSSIDEKVVCIAAILNEKIALFESAPNGEGVQTFQQRILKIIAEHGLSDERWIDVVKVGVHPDNREKVGLVPVDVHELLALIASQGWSWSECAGALGCEIPPNSTGAAWRKFNVELANKSDGYLPEVDADNLDIVSARGSHTTSGVRCMKLGAKGIHDALCTDGKVSRNKIIDRQPSMNEPIDKGMKYTVIKWQLAMACPRLMEILSRTGNASHGVARTQTALQGCKRVLSLASTMPKDTPDFWEKVARAACIGMAPDYAETAKAYCGFVQQWSGGKDGRVIDELVAYERILPLKRTIAPADLKSLGEIKFWDGPRYVPAMVKALLLAPPNFVDNGVAKLFTQNDYSQLSSTASKLKKLAYEAHHCMTAANTFFDAYVTINEIDKIKIIGELEVRCVMLAHSKKSTTRAESKSFKHIALAAYQLAAEKMRADDRTIPRWEYINELMTPAQGKIASQTAIREFDSEGTIADVDLQSHGFKVDVTIVKVDVKEQKSTDSPSEFVIKDVSDQQVILNGGDGTEVRIHRSELLNHYKLKPIDKIVSYNFGAYFNPSQTKDMAQDIARGVIKSAIRSLFNASSEQYTQIVKKNNKCSAVVTKDFPRIEMLNIVPLTNSIIIGKSPPGGQHVVLGSLDCFGIDSEHAYAKSMTVWPKDGADAMKAGGSFIVAFWNIEQVSDPQDANCTIVDNAIGCNVMQSKYQINIPLIKNTKPIKKGQELKCYKQKEKVEPIEETPAKKPRTVGKIPPAKRR